MITENLHFLDITVTFHLCFSLTFKLQICCCSNPNKYLYQNEHKKVAMSLESTKNHVGTPLVKNSDMKDITFKHILLITGIMVAIIVVFLFNSAFLSVQPAQQEQSATTLHEFVHYSIPNVLFYF